MENSFGPLKQNISYGKEASLYKGLKQRIERYLNYCNNEHLKQKMVGISPVHYRTHVSRLAEKNST
ncbi:IS3 family transposase [Planococcus soli]|uniref:IS3 family transposase n=1 Tax=Planococcus soli TaxID=2666072 RepID=UPI00115D9B16